MTPSEALERLSEELSAHARELKQQVKEQSRWTLTPKTASRMS